MRISGASLAIVGLPFAAAVSHVASAEALQPSSRTSIVLRCTGEMAATNYYRLDLARGRIDNLSTRRRWEKLCDGADNDHLVTGSVTLIKSCRVDRRSVNFLNRSFDSRGTVIERSLNIDLISQTSDTTMHIRNLDPTHDTNRGTCHRIAESSIPGLRRGRTLPQGRYHAE